MKIEEYSKAIFTRSGIEQLPSHLESVYDIKVEKTAKLDVGVFRIDRSEGASWIARLFPAARSIEDIRGDADILRFLEQQNYPAERCASQNAVSELEGQGVLVTEFVPGHKPKGSTKAYIYLGALLGWLHSLPANSEILTRKGGAWHHWLVQGGPRDEINAVLALLADAKHFVPDELAFLYDELYETLKYSDDFHDLPHALTHPDFVPANVIVTGIKSGAIIDWAGAGRGPRIWSLGFLLWAAGMRNMECVDAVINGYRRYIELQSDELNRLSAAIRIRPLIFNIWNFCIKKRSLEDMLMNQNEVNKKSEIIAQRAIKTNSAS